MAQPQGRRPLPEGSSFHSGVDHVPGAEPGPSELAGLACGSSASPCILHIGNRGHGRWTGSSLRVTGLAQQAEPHPYSQVCLTAKLTFATTGQGSRPSTSRGAHISRTACHDRELTHEHREKEPGLSSDSGGNGWVPILGFCHKLHPSSRPGS